MGRGWKENGKEVYLVFLFWLCSWGSQTLRREGKFLTDVFLGDVEM